MAIADRLAGAPISWGVCEVPDWGWQPDPALDPVPEIELARVGITATLQPHVGTLVETADDVGRVLAGSGIGLCLATGHLLIGGADPVALAAEHAGRIRHTHLKDVDASWARRVQSGEVSYTDAVRGGMYRPLGQGDVDIAAIVGSLERAGYDGWYVLEQDMILAGPPAIGHDGTGDDAAGRHPIDDVRASIEHLLAIGQDLS